jgi:hypothetical protein
VNMTQKVSPLLNRGNRSRRVPIWLTTLPWAGLANSLSRPDLLNQLFSPSIKW